MPDERKFRFQLRAITGEDQTLREDERNIRQKRDWFGQWRNETPSAPDSNALFVRGEDICRKNVTRTRNTV